MPVLIGFYFYVYKLPWFTDYNSEFCIMWIWFSNNMPATVLHS